jgi:TolB-like protein/Flp pilus assembly protein TadD
MGRIKLRTGLLASLSSLITLMTIIVFSLANFTSQPAQTQFSRSVLSPSRLARIKSIAVLPFKQLTADGENGSLGIGMADTLITALSSIGGIIVRPTSAVFRYSGFNRDPLAAGRQQKVDAVIDGSVQMEGDKVRITVCILSIADRSSLWAFKSDFNRSDLFAVQDSIAGRVAAALKPELSSDGELKPPAKRYTRSTEAFEAYLKGRFFWNKRTEEGFTKAAGYFQQALDLDPGYSLAYVGLADCYLFGGAQPLPPKLLSAKAKSMAQRALEIDPSLGEAHASLGIIAQNFDMNWPEAERQYKRAIELTPNYATAHHWYGEFLALMGRFEDALAELRRAHELNPLSLIVIKDWGEVLYLAGLNDLALEQYRKALELDPDFFVAHLYAGFAYARKGEFSSAIAELQNARLIQDSPEVLGALGYVYAISGNRREAEKYLNELRELSTHRFIAPGHMAVIFAGLGERDRAFEWLEKDRREGSLLTGLKVDPRYDNLREDPRFAELTRRVGLAR